MTTNNHQPESILHLSKEGKDLPEFHGGLEELLRFFSSQRIEEQLDGLHVVREVQHPSQHYQEDNQHEQ